MASLLLLLVSVSISALISVSLQEVFQGETHLLPVAGRGDVSLICQQREHYAVAIDSTRISIRDVIARLYSTTARTKFNRHQQTQRKTYTSSTRHKKTITLQKLYWIHVAMSFRKQAEQIKIREGGREGEGTEH